MDILGVKIPKCKIHNEDIYPEDQLEYLVSLYELDKDHFCLGKILSYAQEDDRFTDEILQQLKFYYGVIPYTHPKFLDKYNFGMYSIFEDGTFEYKETY